MGLSQRQKKNGLGGGLLARLDQAAGILAKVLIYRKRAELRHENGVFLVFPFCMLL
jgi:hypothetical protein